MKRTQHTQNPGAQWFPDAGLGLFLHRDEASVRRLETSWPMMAGTRVGWGHIEIKDDPAEFARIVREQDYNLDGKKPQITPNEYWALAKEFNPTNFHPEVWLKKAKDAGFKYAVFTTKHHSGFAMWPSAYGGFNTEDRPIHGRDLVKEYVDACRKVGLKAGLYFSGPDCHFDRDYQNFYTMGWRINIAVNCRNWMPISNRAPPNTPRKKSRPTKKRSLKWCAVRLRNC